MRILDLGLEALRFHDFKISGFKDVHVYVYMYVMGPGADPYFLGFGFGL